MQFTATRDDRQRYTLQQALSANRTSDGGFYVPVDLPVLSPEEIAALQEKSFGQCAAQILNLLFDTELSCWDVDFSIGRNPVRLNTVGHRMLIGECWHNPEGSYEYLVKKLSVQIGALEDTANSWLQIGCRIAVLFGIYSQLLRQGFDRFDISVVTGDFLTPLSAWYARKMGLPIDNIVCCCNENHPLWDLICQGQIRTDSLSVLTSIPEANVTLPMELERLIYDCKGSGEVLRYLEICNRGALYIPDAHLLNKLQKNLSVSVVSSQRVKDTIRDIWRTHGYMLTQTSSLAYAGAMDFRVKNGVTRPVVILSDYDAMQDTKEIAEVLNIAENALIALFQ